MLQNPIDLITVTNLVVAAIGLACGVQNTLPVVEYLRVPSGKALPFGKESLQKLARSEFNCVVRVLAAIQMKAFNMDSSTYGPLISGGGNALHLKGNSALVDFSNQIGLSPCYQALETENKLLFDMNYSKPKCRQT